MKLRSKSISIVFLSLLLFMPSLGLAHEWPEHQKDIEELERGIYKLQQELDTLVEKKKNTRERARIEQTLQRIVEIHAELISMRKSMDNTRSHLKLDHPQQAHILDDYDSRMKNIKNRKRKFSSTLTRHLDRLLIKVQMKYSSFTRGMDRKPASLEVDKVIEKKEKVKREREADVYLRKRSKVKLVK